MIITISQQSKVRVVDIEKNDTCRMAGYSMDIDLFDILDDLLAIDWIGMASILFRGHDDWVWKQEFDPDYPFTDYETFHEWLNEHHCLHKDSIAPVTFELLKTQFPSFDENTWDRFYNALLFLNTEGFLTDLDVIDRREQFYKMFPKVSFLSPFKDVDRDPVEMLSKFVFSSNLEMLVYDIIKDIYDGEYEICSEQELREFCTNLCDSFYFHNREAEEVDYMYTFERFMEDYFKEGFSSDIPDETYKHIQILHHLLTSKYFNSHLIVEFRYNQYEQGRYGQERFPISYFVDADLTDRFGCKEYIYECYAKYEVTGVDIFNINKDMNLILLMGLYASCFSNLSFAKCNTCGHFFVRNTKNKKQIRCNRCKETLSIFGNMAEIMRQAKGIQTNSQTAKNRLDAAIKKKESRINEILSGFDTKLVVELYYQLISEYRGKIADVITLMSREYIKFDYEELGDYYLVELNDQIEQEIKLVPSIPAQLSFVDCISLTDFDFKKYYDEHLTPKAFFSCFELMYDAAIDKKEEKINRAALQFQIIFADLKSIFLSYRLDVSTIEKIQAKFFALIERI